MIAGHERILRYFSRVLARGTLAHAYLLHGPASVGKSAVARAIASAALCAAADVRPGGCGSCEECRLVAAGAHPDVIVLAPDRPLLGEAGDGISIAEVRELRRRLAATALRAPRIVAIIEDADRMEPAAQSVLLKTLEEPPGTHLLFLVTARPGLLLPTMLSRSIPVAFGLVADELLAAFARARRLPDAPERIRACRGRPGLFIRFSQDPRLAKQAGEAREQFEGLAHRPLAEIFAFVERQSKSEAGIEPWLEETVAAQASRLAELVRIGDRAALGRWERVTSIALDRLGRLATTNVNQRLAGDRVAIALHAGV